MTELTAKQKSHLRGLGQRFKYIATVGKAGLTPALTENISHLLDQHELIKVSIPAGPGPERQETAQALAEATGAALVGLIGRVVLIYRPNDQLPPDRRVPTE